MFCIYCGMEPTDPDYGKGCFQPDGNTDGEHTLGVDVIQRDGARGQYLTPMMVGDMESLGVDVPADVRLVAEKWLASALPEGMNNPDPTKDEFQLVTDFTMYSGEYALADLGYVVTWDDGYVIYKVAE